jgi:calcineurin-like phosphoesterase family protein
MFDAQTSPIMLIYSSRRGGSRVEGPTTASARRTAPTFLVVVLATLIAVGCSSERTPSSPEVARSPVVVAVGDIAADCRREAHEGSAEATAVLLDDIQGTVLALGDLALPQGSAESFQKCYDLSWGHFKWRTRPVPGNHEYYTEGAAGYFDYFGRAAGEPGKGYYSYNLGSWHLVALNSNCERIGGCDESSPQVRWLKADLAANDGKRCTLAYMHHPRFSSGEKHGNTHYVKPLWGALYEAGAEVVLSANEHNYERFAPQNPGGREDPEDGIREFVVGTGGGKGTYPILEPIANSEVHNDETYGVLKLTLNPKSYEWRFVPVEGETFSDSGSARCH